ncbi:TMH family membrane protein [Chlamydia abortus]|uniref:IncA family protein n=1 Tax=Chlamydia abortus TaxID=83555 RepID=UPI000A27DE3F|nr:IncA family protein [Chlamydia abortus]SGA18656.1 TMH family membrane protein [Chlamydia abortus]SHD80137.1 TMH family membrane protein [Chlamydia abortus]
MTTSLVNTTPIATHVPTTQHALSNISSNKYQRLATVIALLAGMVLVGTLIGALVCFALPASLTLVTLVSTSLLASVILLSMSVYNLVSQFRRASSYAQIGKENIRLEAEMIALQEKLTRSEVQLQEEQGRSSELSVKLMSTEIDLDQANQEKASLESKVKALKELVEKYPAIAEESQLIQSLDQVAVLVKQKEELKSALEKIKEEGAGKLVTVQGEQIDLADLDRQLVEAYVQLEACTKRFSDLQKQLLEVSEAIQSRDSSS